MKRVYFIRHAKSAHSDKIKDFDRVLNKRGEGDALLMAERLRFYKVMPDLVISSPAKRAYDTACIIAETLGYEKEMIDLKKELYDSTCIKYLSVIQNVDDKNQTIFLIGHNPDITEVCEALSGSIIGNIPTTGIFCIEFSVDSFREITRESGKVLFFDLPKKHHKKEE